MLASFERAIRRIWYYTPQVITVDVRNHGDSEHSSEMTFETMSYDIQKVLSQENIPKAILIGHSLGGLIAMETALSSPDCIEKCIVIDVRIGCVPEENKVGIHLITQNLEKVISSRVKSLEEAGAMLGKMVTHSNRPYRLLRHD